MSLINTAIDYILGIITKDETVQKFPKEFVSTSAKWIRSWFLKDDENLTTKLEDPTRPIDSKRGMIEYKLEDALKDAEFKAALEKQVAAFEQERENIVNQTTISGNTVGGNLTVGNVHTQGDYVGGNKIEVQKTINGNQTTIQGNQTVHHHYYSAPPTGQFRAEEVPIDESSLPENLKMRVKFLLSIGQTKRAIKELMDNSNLSDSAQNTLILQSGRIHRVETSYNQGIISAKDADLERNRINYAMLDFVDNEL